MNFKNLKHNTLPKAYGTKKIENTVYEILNLTGKR